MSEDREQKNAVFGSVQVQPPTQHSEIPVEIAPLPSSGKVYPENSTIHNVERIEISAMTTKQEDILTSRALIKKGTVITELIRSCLLDKSIEPTDLLVGDRNALMVSIRANGYGADYEGKTTCGNADCGVESQQVFDLAALPIKRLDIEPIKLGVNEFAYKLPLSNKDVTFRFLTGRDEEDVIAAAEQRKKNNLVLDTNVTTRLLHSIVSIDGERDRSKISFEVRKMLAGDSRALRAYITKHEPGIEMSQKITCPACGNVEEVSVPLGVSFFWPDS